MEKLAWFLWGFAFSGLLFMGGCGSNEDVSENVNKGKQNIQTSKNQAEKDLAEIKEGNETLTKYQTADKIEPIVSKSIPILEQYITEKGWEWKKFDRLVGKFPYLKGFSSIVYDSYTLAVDDKTVFIMWHLSGFEDLNQAMEFNLNINNLKTMEPEAFSKHKKRFRYWGIANPHDVFLLQTAKDLKEFDKGLFGILYQHFRLRSY